MTTKYSALASGSMVDSAWFPSLSRSFARGEGGLLHLSLPNQRKATPTCGEKRNRRKPQTSQRWRNSCHKHLFLQLAAANDGSLSIGFCSYAVIFKPPKLRSGQGDFFAGPIGHKIATNFFALLFPSHFLLFHEPSPCPPSIPVPDSQQHCSGLPFDHNATK
jgi:hypothetical protein